LPRASLITGLAKETKRSIAVLHDENGGCYSKKRGGSSSAKLTWERSGFSPQDNDVAQISDGFSASVIYGLES